MVSSGNIQRVKKKGMKQMTKLSNSISVAEMMHIREVEGLTNADIAKRLGTSTKTVYAYIGKQPSGMRKPWGSNRKKDKLPTLSENTEVPEMPHKSFAERCEEVLHKPDAGNLMKPETLKETIMRVPEDPKPCTLADLTRETHERKLTKMVDVVPMLEDDKDNQETPEPLTEEPTPYTMYKGDDKRNLPFPELISVFGPDTVRSYLRVALYAGAVDKLDVKRSDMLKALDTLNKALNYNREVITFD